MSHMSENIYKYRNWIFAWYPDRMNNPWPLQKDLQPKPARTRVFVESYNEFCELPEALKKHYLYHVES
jgi:hypothetical protein